MPTLVEINCALNKGSTGKITEQIGLFAQSLGWNVYVFCGSKRHQYDSKLKHIQTVNKHQELWHVLNTRLFDNHGLSNDRETFKIIEQLKSIKPDIVHLHNIHGYYINYEILFNYLIESQCKVVWTLHDCWSFTGHCSHFEKIGCTLWKTGCHSCPQKHEYPKSILIDNSKRNYNLKKQLFTSLKSLTLVPVSDWLHNLLLDSFFYNRENVDIQTIHNGIDLNIFDIHKDESINLRDNLNLKEQIVCLAVANAWSENKGLQDLIQLNSSLPNEFKIIVVGINDKQKKHLPNNIIGINRTSSQSELAVLYTMADIFINPTYADTFPTTNIESLACGTPVITYKTGGSPEIIDQETGIIVPKGDIKGLAKACIELSRKSDNISNKCRERAVNLYNKDNRFLDYIKLYNKILSK